MNKIIDIMNNLKDEYNKIEELDKKVEVINFINMFISEMGPFNEPVGCVQWVTMDKVKGNEWNPNSVAPPEMRLLYDSIKNDGYTQPIVAKQNEDGTWKVVDGFHRHRVGKEHSDIKEKLKSYFPIVPLNKEKADLMASTIRHNRARGSHDIDLMSNIVAELHELGRTDTWIAKHLGMDTEEILRLKQITGIAALFKDNDFSRSWEEIK